MTFRDELGAEARRFYDAPEFDFIIEKTTASLEKGRTISHDAVMAATERIHDYVMAQIMRAWDERSEPPSFIRITVRVEAQ